MLDVERLEVLLTAVDVVRTAMDSAASGQPPGDDAIARATARLQQAMHTAPPVAPPPPAAVMRSCRYRVSFVPEASFFRSGNDPLCPLRDLQRIGDTEIRVNLEGVPPFSTLDPEDLHLSWTVDVTTTSSPSDIKAIFDWVEDVATIEIVALEGGRIDPIADHIDAPADAYEDHGVEQPVFGTSIPALPVSDVTKSGTRSNELTSIRVPTARLDALVDMIGELVITQALLTELNTEGGRVEGTRDALDELARSTRQIQEAVMRLRMQPINVVFSRMPRVVHDLATRMGKDVQLVILGEQTEVDKNVVQHMADPLMHLVRNALDHGLEMPAARIAAGKNPRGTVTLSAAHQAGQVVVEVRDDGAGVNRERVERRARERGIVKEGERLSDDEVLDLLFAPGFSTAETVSDISGRGVGLDVVRSNIRSLGGTIVIKSDPGRGSTFLIRLPLTVSIIDAQLIAVANEVYIVPLLSVVETIQLDRAHLRPIPGQRSVYTLRGQPLPVVRLRDELGLVDRPAATRELLMVVEGEGQRAAFIVDDIVGQQQVVLKSLEDNYRRLDCFVGASILGNGRVALILDVGRITTRSAATNRLRSIEAPRLVTPEVFL